MAFRGKYEGQAIAATAGRSLTYSPSGVRYPVDDKSRAALLKPYGMITAHEMGHIGGGIVRRLVGKGRIVEHFERQAQENSLPGCVSVFLLYIDPRDGTMYVQRQEIPQEQVRRLQWQEADDGRALPPIQAATPICRLARTHTLHQRLAPLAKLDEQLTEARKTRTTRLLERLGPSPAASRRRGS